MVTLLRMYAGRLLNLLGVPAVVAECDYSAKEFGTKIKVRKLDLLTLISVNGLDVYFNRITGTIDGVGFNPSVCYSAASTPGSTGFDVPHETPQVAIRMRTTGG
jgi:hypothetical protein